MAVQILWILLTSIEVVYLEQPVFVPSAAELSDAPPENKQEWLHPVIFEPQDEIQLTRSTYQVTTFLDFAPFMNGFSNVQNYIKSFKADVSNPTFPRLNIKARIWVLHPYWMSRIWKPLCSQLIANKYPMHA